MSDFLSRVAAERRADMAAARADHPLHEVIRRAEGTAPATAFARALRERRRDRHLAVIAEVKRISPALGALAPRLDPARLARRYQDAGAAAISVLVEPRHWGGSLEDLRAVVDAVGPAMPILAKDVVVDEYQIALARSAGASAVLLIAEIFDDRELGRLVVFARGLGVDALVEAHEPEAFARAVRSGAPAVGVNARDLREPSRIVPGRIRELAAELATDQLLVAESGISSARDAEELPPRVDAVLVGTALVRADDPAPLVEALAAVRPAKAPA